MKAIEQKEKRFLTPFLQKGKSMDLEMFIAETLRQIVKGIKMAQEHDDCKEHKSIPREKDGTFQPKKASP